ncbi:Cysteine-rich receptor-like protein kinase 45 [Raphanus sativus]|uniref:Cysteine-rich receptor-like protein kinase 45 n=1 Tax=Raphanus sativus TaxID=3726 RepID=A0A6J0MRN2_RAPSA|nr:cysteine-rich receptor-like protein kinase 45 [Raphanus sativus]KAJ4905795.1 Cysteine-rich receptor-like protein kinase 45 [Raphanus sativus]
MAGTSFLDTVFRRKKKNSSDFITTGFLGTFEFDFETIRAATDNFSHVIGRGGFGSVYKGRLQSGEEIAVKRFLGSSTRSERDFSNEVEILSKLKHKNLIHLLGFCSKQDQRYLVYEFMPNSSLQSYISDPHRDSHQLSWEMCRNIVQGIARGLRYIHEESQLWVVHRDIKPSNILLDLEFKPKIAGFELARMMQQGESEGESTVIVGTIGFLDPEYMRTGRVSIKSDVYAFGVTILMIISRKRAYSSGDQELLIEYVMRCWNREEAIYVVHEVMREQEREDSISEILRYIHIALLCIDGNAETRPTIDTVLHWFSCCSTPLPEPTIGGRFLAEAETNLSFSPSLSPGHSSVMSPTSSRYGD